MKGNTTVLANMYIKLSQKPKSKKVQTTQGTLQSSINIKYLKIDEIVVVTMWDSNTDFHRKLLTKQIMITIFVNQSSFAEKENHSFQKEFWPIKCLICTSLICTGGQWYHLS